MLHSTQTRCLVCRRLRVKIRKTSHLSYHEPPLGIERQSTCVRFCWVPSHCGIEGNEIVGQLAKETLDHDIDPLTIVHYADLKPSVNSYIQQEVQTKCDVSIHCRDLYLVKPTLGLHKKFQHLTKAEEVVKRTQVTRCNEGGKDETKKRWAPDSSRLLYSDCRTTNYSKRN